MANAIVILILVLIVGWAIWYIRKESKKGIKCVGCPYAKGCTGNTSCNSKKSVSRSKPEQAKEKD